MFYTCRKQFRTQSVSLFVSAKFERKKFPAYNKKFSACIKKKKIVRQTKLFSLLQKGLRNEISAFGMFQFFANITVLRLSHTRVLVASN